MKYLFCIQNTTHYRTLFDYIKELSVNNEIVTYLVRPELERLSDELSKFSKVCRVYKQNDKPKFEKIKMNSKTSKGWFRTTLSFFYMFKTNIQSYLKCCNIINNLNPDCVYISSDRYINFDLFLAIASLKKKIPVIVTGVNLFFVKNTGAYYKTNPSREIKTFGQKLICWFFPNQAFYYQDKKCLFYEPYVIINLYLMRCLPRIPWLNGSTFVSETHVDCEKTKEIYIGSGVKSEIVKVTGLLEYKFLNSSKNNLKNIRDEFKIFESEFVVIFALPQLYEHNLISKEENDIIIIKLMEILNGLKNCKIIISLHPKMAEKDYLYLVDKYDVQISHLPLRNILPVANVFISTYSSTVLWSIMLGIPSVIYDFFNLNYQVYDENKAVYVAKEWEDFKKIVFRLVDDKSYYMVISELQKKDSKMYGDLNLFGLVQ